MGRIIGGSTYSISQRNAELYSLPQAAHETGNRSGQSLRMANQGSTVAVNFNFLLTKVILSLRHSRGAQRVRNHDYTFYPKQMEGHTHYTFVDVDTIADKLRLDTGSIKGGTDNGRSTVMEGGHTVVQMGDMGCTGTECGGGSVVVSDSMGDGYGNTHFNSSLDKVYTTRLFRSYGNHSNTALGSLLQAVKHRNIRSMQVTGVLRTPFSMAEEGTLQMEADDFGTARIFCPVGSGCSTDGSELILWQSHAGRADIGDTLTQLIVCDVLQPLR